MARTLTGIRRRGNKWWVFVKVRGRVYSKTFDLSTLPETMQAWREAQHGIYGGVTPAAESLAADVETYLARKDVKRLTVAPQVRAHLELWLSALGRDRPRTSVTTADVNAALESWLEAGLAPGTVRKRRTTLRSFYVRMNGEHARAVNPVQEAINPEEPKAADRSLSYVTIERALALMPERRSAKRGTRGDPSLARIRARVIAYTGLPPGLLQQVQPDDLSFREGTLAIAGREKGDGLEARVLELTPEGLAAFKDFHAVNAYGVFSISSLGRSVKAAFKRAGHTRPMRLYDLRHSFLAQLYRTTRDLATVGRLGLHAEGSPMTARYAKGANRDVDAAAVAAFSTGLAALRQGAIKPVPVIGTVPQRKKA